MNIDLDNVKHQPFARYFSKLKFRMTPIQTKVKIMVEDAVLVSITASREKGEIVYKLDCSSDLTNEELEYYLEEIIKGICEWKPSLCKDNIRSLTGTIKSKKKEKGHQSKPQ